MKLSDMSVKVDRLFNMTKGGGGGGGRGEDEDIETRSLKF